MALSTVTKLLIAGGIAATVASAWHLARSDRESPGRIAREARELRRRGESYPALHRYEEALQEARERDRTELVASLEGTLAELRTEIREGHRTEADEQLRLLQAAGQEGCWSQVLQHFEMARSAATGSDDPELAERVENVSDSPHIALAKLASAYQTWGSLSGGHGTDPLVGLYSAFQVQDLLKPFPGLRRIHSEVIDARESLRRAQDPATLAGVAERERLRAVLDEKEGAFQGAITDSLREAHQVDPSTRSWKPGAPAAGERTVRGSPAARPASADLPGDGDLHRADS